MDRLLKQSVDIFNSAGKHFKRFIFSSINTDENITGIIGSPNTGRTGLLLQLMQRTADQDKKVLYLNLADLSFSHQNLAKTAKEFYRRGGEILYVDDIQRYWNAGSEIVGIINDMPDLKIVYSGSFLPEGDEQWLRMKEISKIYQLPGLSYREFLEQEHKHSFPQIQFDELLELNRNPGSAVLNRIRPLELFYEYLEQGYYTIDSNSAGDHQTGVHAMINSVLDSDLSSAYNLDNISKVKIRKLLVILADGGLYRPNIEKLAREIDTTRDSLLKFIKYSERAGLIRICYRNNAKSKGKPQMLCLNNSSLINALSPGEADQEKMYEAFLVNQLSFAHDVRMETEDSFIIDGKYTFQMSWKQDRAGKKAPPPDYIVEPDREYQSGTRLPLWMFGFLY